MSKRYLALSLMTVFVLLAAACAPQAPATQAPATDEPAEPTEVMTEAPTEAATEPPASTEPKILRLAPLASDFGTIDPALATQSAEIQIAETTTLGVVRQNETTAEIELAMATGYEVSDDGLTYTVDIMNNVPWVHYNAETGEVEVVQDCDGNDRMVTAQDFVYGIVRTIDPATASDYAYALLPYIEGAAEFNDGTNTDPESVGVRAVDEDTIEYTFTAPAVYNLNLLGLWIAHATPQWLIEGDECTDAAGDRWTEQEFFQGYGPYTLKEWIHDSNLTLIKNPFWPGTENVPQAKIDEIEHRFLDTSPALSEFEAGNLDIAAIPSEEWDRIHSDPAYADMIRPIYTLGTEWYGFNTKLAPTDDQRVRLALSLAIDRELLVQQVVKGGIPAQFFTNPGAAGAPKPELYPDDGVKYDPEQAKALLDEYLTENNLAAEDLQLTLMANSSEGNQRTGEAIVGMWNDVLGIDVTFVTQERAVYLDTRTEGNENIYRNSWVQDYPDANNFLYDVFGLNAAFTDVVDWPINVGLTEAEEYEPGSNENFDRFTELLQQAANEQDPQARMDLYAQAEQILLIDEAVVAPLYWYSDDILIRPEIQDTESITGYDHYEKWDIVR
ncbi:MAG TPA: peptide ABC transporter substrate-binding protein [Anaerolineales bacterium]|nr:peptide ABC transporter substrate-binding protein [Anaerolineales bacterium]